MDKILGWHSLWIKMEKQNWKAEESLLHKSNTKTN